MITTTEFLNKGNFNNTPDMLIEFAEEAIKADRINLLEHVTASIQNTGEGYNDEAVVDKESILNAPNIQLL